MIFYGTLLAYPIAHMPYLPRYMIICDDSYFHVTWRCHNKDWLLKWDWAKEIYYNLLLKYKDRFGIEIYSYNFMDNHPHLTGHLKTRKQFSDFFKLVNSLFAKKVNKKLGRCGQVVMDRFKSPMIESDRYMLTVMTYVDLNQYRAKKVKHPRDNKWSSYHYYAYGNKNSLITPSPSYLALGEDKTSRQNEYRRIVESLIYSAPVLNISRAHFFGSPDWILKKYAELKETLKTKHKEHHAPACLPEYQNGCC